MRDARVGPLVAQSQKATSRLVDEHQILSRGRRPLDQLDENVPLNKLGDIREPPRPGATP